MHALRILPLATILVALLSACERRHPVSPATAYAFRSATDRAQFRLQRTSAPALYPAGAALEVWRVGGGRYVGHRERVWALVAPAGRLLPDTIALGETPAGLAASGNPAALRWPGRYEVRLQPDAGVFRPLEYEVDDNGMIAPEAAT